MDFTLPSIGFPDLGENLMGDLLPRIRWNSNVLGLLAHRMDAEPADPAIAVAPHDSGTHLRWRFDPSRGWPGDGFYIYRRPDRGHWVKAMQTLDFRALSRDPASLIDIPFLGARVLKLLHTSGTSLVPPRGLIIPASNAALRIRFPVSMHDVAIEFSHVNNPVVVQGYHGNALVFHAALAPAALVPPPCREMIDELRVFAPDCAIARIQGIAVCTDVRNWQPIGRIPPFGTAPLDVDSLVSRLGPDPDPDAESPAVQRTRIQEIVTAIRGGATAAPVTWTEKDSLLAEPSAIEIAAPVLVDTMALRPRMARAFGLYAVDPTPLDQPTDYMVVGSWGDDSGAPAAGIALYEHGHPDPELEGVPFETLTRRLIDNPGLLYLAPVFHVSPERARPPLAAALPTLIVSDDARRQLSAAGVAHLEIPLRAEWDLAAGSTPRLAREVPSLRTVEFAVDTTVLEPELGPSRIGAAGLREANEVVSIPVLSLPTNATVRVTSVDVFGQITSATTSAPLELPATLYPTAPPPVAFTGSLAVTGAGAGVGVELRSSWVWGGRSALFHPNVQGFDIEWIEDLDFSTTVPLRQALDDATTWTMLTRVVPAAHHNLSINSIDAVLTTAALQIQLAYLDRTELAAGPLYGAIRTSLSLAPQASGRLNGWTATVGGQDAPIARHTLGDDVWLHFLLDGGAAGTPFEGIAIDADPVDLAGAVELRVVEPASTTDDPESDTRRESLSIVTIVGTVAARAAVTHGALLTQGIDVFPVSGRSADPTEQVIVQMAFKKQEPGDDVPERIEPALGAASVAPVQTNTQAVAATAPSRQHPLRGIYVRARTVDHLGRRGEASTPFETVWSFVPPPAADLVLVPAPGPTVVQGYPTDAHGQCRLLVAFDLTLAQCGAILYRATDDQLRTVWKRWQKRATVEGWTLLGLPTGFILPAGKTAPEQIVDPIADFAGSMNMMRIFIHKLRARAPGEPAGSAGRPVFDEAFVRRGEMWRQAARTESAASANGDPLEFLDIGEKVGNAYFYRASVVDTANREEDLSGVGVPGRGLDISPAAAPRLLPPLFLGGELLLLWEASEDKRITGYRVTRTPQWAGAPAADVTNLAPAATASPLRVEAGRVSLPKIPIGLAALPAIERATGGSLQAEGRLVAREGSFVFWHADGCRAALQLTSGDGSTIRDLVPASDSGGLSEGTTVYIEPLRIGGGVVDTASWDGLAVSGSTLALSAGATDVTVVGYWRATSFLTVLRLEEGARVVLELTSSEKVENAFTRRSIGRCPASPAEPLITVSSGIVSLAGVNANERVTGVFRADAVTLAAEDGTPDPERSGAKSLMSAVRVYAQGFVRRVREEVPMVFEWTSTLGPVRYAGVARAIPFSDGNANTTPWNEATDELTGVFERAALSIVDGVVSGTATATNLVGHVLAQPRLGRLTLLLPDDSIVVARCADGATVARGNPRPLVWQKGTLDARGILGTASFSAAHLYDATVASDGTVTANVVADAAAPDRIGSVAIVGTAIVVAGAIPDGTEIRARYQPKDESAVRTVENDDRRAEHRYAIAAADIGRRWKFTVQAICDFAAPVNAVPGAVSTVEVEVPPPPDARVTLDSVTWLESGELRVLITGKPGMRYRVEALAAASRATVVLADDTAATDVTTLVDVDDSPLPFSESLTVFVTARYPNAPAVTYRAEQSVAARDPEAVIDAEEE